MKIYVITNVLTGKQYVGQTHHDITGRLKQHARDQSCCRLFNSIRKHGIEHFTVDLIDLAQTQSELDRKESYWIAKLNTLAPNGYNLRTGGAAGRHSDETRMKMSISRMGIRYSVETRLKMSLSMKGRRSPNRGKKLSSERIEQMRIAAAKRLVCLNTGLIFESCREAAKHFDVSVQTITRNLKRSHKSRTKLNLAPYVKQEN